MSFSEEGVIGKQRCFALSNLTPFGFGLGIVMDTTRKEKRGIVIGGRGLGWASREKNDGLRRLIPGLNCCDLPSTKDCGHGRCRVHSLRGFEKRAEVCAGAQVLLTKGHCLVSCLPSEICVNEISRAKLRSAKAHFYGNAGTNF
ncbi:hypothetical protein CBR_g38005 [Chara braunii]|uniref:Uncharacterized protein n=1 Tax=Chara braunii TaxID=69332 RepID=A0A388LP61_CHABU|nr:hypothetical protein CBR_g38005 [Chara braunii]|eukprot:GBG84130.1 hypothetical protein CBR_g38005 [Chara braunii]